MRKVIFPVILIIVISCENKIVQESKTTVDTISTNQLKLLKTTRILVISQRMYQIISTVLLFLLVKILCPEMKNSCYRNLWNWSFLNQDDEYKLIDQAQRKNMINVELRNMQKRYLRSFNTYTEASQERERLLGINQDNRYVNNPRDNYPVNHRDTVASPYYTVIDSQSIFL